MTDFPDYIGEIKEAVADRSLTKDERRKRITDILAKIRKAKFPAGKPEEPPGSFYP